MIRKVRDMPLEDFIFPGETVRYQCQKEIMYAKNPYVLYITDRRVLGHKRKGLIFKKDQVFSAALEEIRNLTYHEEGIIRKRGILILQTVGQTLPFEGDAEEVKVVFREMQQFLGQSPRRGAQAMLAASTYPGYNRPPPPPPENHTSPTMERVVYKEIVKIKCPYCQSLMLEDANHCTECGAPLR